MDEFWLTPFSKNIEFNQPFSIEDKIRIFKESTEGWQLDIADFCINGSKDNEGKTIPPIKGSGFAVLHILISYFEMIAKYEEGYDQAGKSREYLKKGFKSVFHELKTYNSDIVDNMLDLLYEKVRCGLYHGGLTESNIILTGDINQALAFLVDEKIITINPHKLPSILKNHLHDYVDKLKDTNNKTLRDNFEKRFDWHRRN